MASKPDKKGSVAVTGPVRTAAAPRSQASNLTGWLFPAYVALIFLGYLMLLTPGAMTAGQEMGHTRALFSAVNAATLTGFPQTADVDKYPAIGQFVIFILMVGGTLLSLIIGGTAVSRILELKYSDWQCVVAAFVVEAAAIGFGMVFLAFNPDRGLAQSAFMAASAFGNAGLIVGPPSGAMSWSTHLVLLPLMTLGGLGLCVLMELYDSLWRKIKPLSIHAQTTLQWTALAYIFGTVLLIGLGLMAGSYFGDADSTGPSLRGLISSSAAATVGSRTAGMGLADIGHLSRPSVWVIMLMMAIGASAGSTAGGIKLTTLAVLSRGVRRTLSDEPAAGKAFAFAVAWVGIYLAIILIPLLLLLHRLTQMPADQVFFNVISAASNVGLTREPLNPDPGTAFILSATMLAGRFGPMMVLWWMADSTRGEEIAVG